MLIELPAQGSLDSIVYDYLSGLSPEKSSDNFDTLSLEQVYGAITHYLSRRNEVAQHLMQNRAKFDALVRKPEIFILFPNRPFRKIQNSEDV